MESGVAVRNYKSMYPADSADQHSPAALPYPSGWFCVGFSKEWRPGDVRTRRFMGTDTVVYRTLSGALRASQPYCPHLGAHLGAGGTVEGELLVCPFHRFAFAPDGACARTPYGKPPKLSLGLLPVCEKQGIVWLWHSPDGTPPAWRLPDFPASSTPSTFRAIDLAGQPQDVLENVVDYGHLRELHGLRFVDVVSEPKGDGPFYSIGLRIGRDLLRFPMDQEVTCRFVGVGAAVLTIELAQLRTRATAWVLATPVAPARMRFWSAARVATDRVPRLPMPLQRAFERALSVGMNWWTVHDIEVDLPIWHHKKYVRHPGLNDGDGPIGHFRHWARQFYPQEIPATS
ncbi:aromatic ring-hydroxylating oxygenase subunit alpha [Streptomyces abikoensis]|uniref:aromatic ring-hydroxylating oxygenase subunit alpha n=1 Tax=Streptomyces abikoensis TaxID=97398 RepID=UPI0033C5F788